MTEVELRQKVCSIMAGWVGGTRGGKEHAEILSIYNAQPQLPRGYKMQVKDDWCAATVSAAFLKAGIAPYTGTECSCGSFITLAKARGIWIEDDAHRPEIGDAIIYDWHDKGNGDDVTGHNHIGIVTAVSDSGKSFTVTEGNMGVASKVGTRQMTVNGRYIRGFICPDYKAIAAAMNAPSWAQKAAYWAVHEGIILGDGTGDMMWDKPITRAQMVTILHRIIDRLT